VTLLYLTEVVWPADGEPTGRPLRFRLISQCATKTDCEGQAERRAKSHAENGFDTSHDAWWGKTGDRVHYYYQTTSRPGHLWNEGKPENGEANQDGDADAQASRTVPVGEREEAGEGPDDEPVNREDRDTPVLPV
jgi:hypothetical protein